MEGLDRKGISPVIATILLVALTVLSICMAAPAQATLSLPNPSASVGAGTPSLLTSLTVNGASAGTDTSSTPGFGLTVHSDDNGSVSDGTSQDDTAAWLTSHEVGNKISITVSFPAPEITEVGGYHRVAMRGLETVGNPGEPVLPSRGVTVLIPYGMEVKGVQVSHGREVNLHGSYYIEPGQMPVPLDSENRVEPTSPDERIYNSH
jgi:flagellin-like protein